MRIVSGKFKGRILFSPPESAKLRPTSDMTRESIFNVVRSDIFDSTFLDLFAGSGAVGFEAISEGAKFAVFVDKNPMSITTIKKNIALLGIAKQSTVIKKDVLQFLASPCLDLLDKKFDIVFIDPPYASLLAGTTLKALASCDFLSENAIVIAEHSSKEFLESSILGSHSLKEFQQKHYGEITVTYYIANSLKEIP